MTCGEWDRKLKLWLAGGWGDEPTAGQPPAELLRHAASCAQCAARLEAARLLMDGAALRAPSPAGLEGRVLSRLERSAQARRRSLGKALVTARLRPLGRVLVPAAAALVAVVITLGVLRGTGPREAAEVRVLLVLEAPQATQVSAVGDWNGWDPQAHPLSDPDGDGVWTVEIRVQRGAELRYQFLIDNQRWVPDPRSPFQVDDGFGGTASVLQT